MSHSDRGRATCQQKKNLRFFHRTQCDAQDCLQSIGGVHFLLPDGNGASLEFRIEMNAVRIPPPGIMADLLQDVCSILRGNAYFRRDEKSLSNGFLPCRCRYMCL